MNDDALNYCTNQVIPSIKALATEKIISILPLHVQLNYNARMNELNKLRHDREWTADEISEVQAMESAWNACRAIRNASNAHENALLAMTTIEQMQQYDITANWPDVS